MSRGHGFQRLIKKVDINHKTLYVSNYRKVIEIPLNEIEKVAGSVFFTLEFVWITLRKRSQFGKRILFAGKLRLSGGFSRHPIVDELRAFAEKGGKEHNVKV